MELYLACCNVEQRRFHGKDMGELLSMLAEELTRSVSSTIYDDAVGLIG